MKKEDTDMFLADFLHEKLVPHLLVNYATLPAYGLLEGQMGGVLFFALYAEKIKNPGFHDFSGLLMEEIYYHLSNMDASFGRGLCGIGWGVEYLIRNGLSDGNTDEILKEIDGKIVEYDPCRLRDRSFFSGLGGILFYVVSRLRSYNREERSLPFDPEYLESLSRAVQSGVFTQQNLIFPESEYISCLQGNINYGVPTAFPQILFADLPEPEGELGKYPVGIKKGLTGLGLKLLGI